MEPTAWAKEYTDNTMPTKKLSNCGKTAADGAVLLIKYGRTGIAKERPMISRNTDMYTDRSDINNLRACCLFLSSSSSPPRCDRFDASESDPFSSPTACICTSLTSFFFHFFFKNCLGRVEFPSSHTHTHTHTQAQFGEQSEYPATPSFHLQDLQKWVWRTIRPLQHCCKWGWGWGGV